MKAQTSCCGVSSARCHALLELDEMGLASLQALAAALKLDASTACRTVDALVAEGLVERSEDRANRRRVLLRPTPAGKRKAAAIHDACDAFYAGIMKGLPEDRRQALLEGAGLLADLLDGVDGRCCPPSPRSRA